MREGNWKLVEQYEDGSLELYDLAADPGEATDLAAKEPGRVAELRGKLEAWRRAVDAQSGTPNPHFSSNLWDKLYRQVDVSRLKPAEQATTLAAELADWRGLMNRVLPGGAQPAGGAGAVMLHARDAKVRGGAEQPKLHYEPEPHKDTLGYWVQADDWAEWQFAAPSAGTFAVEILQGCGTGSGGAEIEITIGQQSLRTKVAETGHFQRFVPRTLGIVRLEAGNHTLQLHARSKPGPAVMDLRRITLRSTEE